MARSRNQGGGGGQSGGPGGGAPVSQLAQQYAQFTASVTQATGAVTAFQAGLQKVMTGAQNLARGLNAIGPGLARGLLAPVTSLAGLAAGISQGTVEGDRLTASMNYLYRVLVDDLAPYVRMLTAGVLELANGWRALDSGTKGVIATWLAVAAVLGAVVLLAPTLAAAFSVAAGVVGVATTVMSALFGAAAAAAGFMWSMIVAAPVVALAAAVAAVAAGFAAYYGYVSGRGGDFADKMKKDNESWVDWVFRLLEWLGEKFVRFWVGATQGSSGFLKMTKTIAQVGEAIGAVEKGTAATVQEMIDQNARDTQAAADAAVAGFKAKLGGLRNWVRDNLADFNPLKGMQGLLDALNRIKNAGGGGGFRIKMDVQFESLQGTFERLQRAFATQSGLGVQEAQLGQLQQINAAAQQMAAGAGKLADLVPAVR